MAHNQKITALDVAQVVKRTYDCDHDAIRVLPAANSETFIEISADDGDSVLSLPLTQKVAQADGEVDATKMRRICKYGAGGSVEVSPDGTTFVALAMSDLEVKQICALKIRVSGCIVVGQS